MTTSESLSAVHDLMPPTPRWAFSEYERIRHRLPRRSPLATTRPPSVYHSLDGLTALFDAFVFDAFGVLNTGDRPLPNAVFRFAELQKAGKRCLILSNAATASTRDLVAKYRRFGFAIEPEQLICSRWLLEQALAENPRQGLWGVIAPPHARPETLPVNALAIHGNADRSLRERMDRCDGFLFLSTQDWTRSHQSILEASLSSYPRPLEVANPDLVAPRGDRLTLEPGFFAHQLVDRTGITPVFYGKPYTPAFEAAMARLGNPDPDRVLMVGDTLHTDILGGQSAGMSTLLVTEHGALKGLDAGRCMERSGIFPTYQAPAI
ncbi:HAD-IIA family hydrolase [Marinobacter sp. JSM 1782161]|uniref:HAD-IIA family hydrolase n=1 Tax=Marinobacter sp. JSM 1782161 TaxID=2685906 RepID=UPI0014025EA7|nr:HAD hydrolase-like protein [Marinobacter sp. JSM 1782161]